MSKKLKRLGLPAMLLAGLLVVLAPAPASAKVHIGVTLGAPVYSYPAYSNAYAYPYSSPTPDYYYGNPYPAYRYTAPAYVAPYATFGWSSRDHDRDRHERREQEHRRHEYWERESHEHRR
jgi:hypothetical protein